MIKMRQWEESDLKFLVNKRYFPECIECGNQFFHKAGCARGASLDAKTLNEKLNRRLAEFEKEHGIHGIKIPCRDCNNPATGEIRIFYHGTESVIEDWPVCIDHAFHEDSEGRESRYIAF
jgi:hypothetical protein